MTEKNLQRENSLHAQEEERRMFEAFVELKNSNADDLVRSVKFTEDLYADYDVRLYSGNTIMLGEIKCRDKDSDFLRRKGAMLQRDKIEKLIEWKRKILALGYTVQLFCFVFTTRDNRCLVYPLCDDIGKYEFKVESLSRDSYKRDAKKYKAVTYLHDPVEVLTLSVV